MLCVSLICYYTVGSTSSSSADKLRHWIMLQACMGGCNNGSGSLKSEATRLGKHWMTAVENCGCEVSGVARLAQRVGGGTRLHSVIRERH